MNKILGNYCLSEGKMASSFVYLKMLPSFELSDVRVNLTDDSNIGGNPLPALRRSCAIWLLPVEYRSFALKKRSLG
jgi:hypothetical protein